MAVLELTPSDEAFGRVQALGRIARTLLATRISCLLLVLIWLTLEHAQPAVVISITVASAWLMLLLLRWSSFGLVVCTHPFIVALDAALCFWALATAPPVSPGLLLVVTGAILAGLCLDRRGAVYFSPMFVAAWLLVYSSSTPQSVSSADVFVSLVLVPALLVGSMFAGVGIRRATLEADSSQRLLRTQVRAAGVAEERARLAREMHDSLVKSLHGVALLADSLPGWVEASPEKAAVQARTIASMITRTSKESRDLIVAMRRADATAAPADLVRGAVDRWQQASGRAATLVVEAEPKLATESSYELAAILSEALDNVDRHTPPEAVAHVLLDARDAWVELVVEDDGGGAADGFARPGHFGVLGMRERAARVGGTLRVESVPDVGVRLVARLPASLDADGLDELDGLAALTDDPVTTGADGRDRPGRHGVPGAGAVLAAWRPRRRHERDEVAR